MWTQTENEETEITVHAEKTIRIEGMMINLNPDLKSSLNAMSVSNRRAAL